MREQRKVVTIVFADVVGSTSIADKRNPEVVRSMMSRYFSGSPKSLKPMAEQ